MSPRNALALLSLLLGLLTAGNGAAQDGRVRLQLGNEEPLWAGQQVTLNLDLLTNGMSFSGTFFNLPEVEGAFLLQTDSSTVKLTEMIGGESWQVLRYPLALYPQAGGPLEIPPLKVRFKTTERFGAEPVAFELETEALTVDITWPPGAPEGSLVVSTRDFELEYDWAPVRDTLRAGDAVTLTVRRKAADISAMLLPPLPLFETEGLAAYPDAPELSDRSNRGALIGERQDRLTWVVERAGEYRIPGIRFQWWDPGAERLRERIIGGLSFSARPDPAAQASPEDGARPAPGSSRWPAAIVTMALLLLGLAAWLARDPERRQRLLASLRDGWHRLRTILRDLRHRIMPPPRALLDRVNPGPRP